MNTCSFVAVMDSNVNQQAFAFSMMHGLSTLIFTDGNWQDCSREIDPS